MRAFFEVWWLGILRPVTAIRSLGGKPAPLWGLIAILVRFVGTALTSILARALLDRRPFVPSYLSVLSEADYYWAEVFLLPVFGLAAWLLSSALVHLILRLSGREGAIDWIMNVVGFSLLVVMPLVWLLDWTGIACGFYGADFTIPIHAAVSLWEVALMAAGFRQMAKTSWAQASALGLIVKGGVYIPLAALLVR